MSNAGSTNLDLLENRSETNGLWESSQIKLPQIKLPLFDGTYNKWLEFKYSFESLIHLNLGIGKNQKFHYESFTWGYG